MYEYDGAIKTTSTHDAWCSAPQWSKAAVGMVLPCQYLGNLGPQASDNKRDRPCFHAEKKF